MKSVSPSLREVRRKCSDDSDNSLELSNRNHLTLGPNTSVLISNPAIHTQDKGSEHQNETIVFCATLLTEHRTKEPTALRRYVFAENGNTPTLLTVPATFPELTPYPLRVDGVQGSSLGT